MWLTSLKAYQQWHDSSTDGLLWIKGIPGSGKSVLAATLIQKLAEEGVPVLFFFFRQIVDANHRPVNLLRDWLDQILVYSPPLQVILREYVENDEPLETVSIQNLWDHLRTALAEIPLVYCVADALDEMDQGNDEFIHCLADLGHWRPSSVKVVMTSRPVATVEDPMRRIAYAKIRMDERFVDVDIATYVQHTLERSSISKSNQDLIKKAVLGRANGLFLYAKLTMNSFLEPDADISATLGKLPQDLNDTYSSILKEHARRSGIPEADQLLILQWVTHTFRPIRLLELADLIKTTVKDKSQFSLKASKDLVRAACGPLLEILPDETISVVHHSLTEYLLGATRPQSQAGFPVIQGNSTHCQLAIACLTYMSRGCLQIDDYHTRLCRQDVIKKQNVKHPFFLYACKYWFWHAAEFNWSSTSGHQLSPHIDGFLSNGPVRYQWLELFWVDSCPTNSPDYDERSNRISDLHIAACCGLTEYLSMIIERDGSANINTDDASGSTPLSLAVRNNRLSCVRVLLKAGATVGLDRALESATRAGDLELVKLFLEVGVDPMRGLREYRPFDRAVWELPVFIACNYARLECMEAFLPHLSRSDKQLALHWAVRFSSSAIVGRLLQDPDVDANGILDELSPLIKCAFGGNADSMEHLIKAGADPSFQCKLVDHRDQHLNHFQGSSSVFFTPLTAFCSRPREEPQLGLSLLVRAGADVNARNEDGMTPLLHAKSFEVMKWLLEAGADPNSENDLGDTMLHLCNHVDSVILLAQVDGIDINKRNLDGDPPLFSLVARDADLALKLLEYKPDLKIKNNKGNGPLHAVLLFQNYSREKSLLLAALLEAGADPNLRNSDGETPLHIFTSHGNRFFNQDEFTTIFALFVRHRADLDARDSSGRTPVFRLISIIQNYTGMDINILSRIDAFRDATANLAIPDKNGRTCLHEVVRCYPDSPFASTPEVMAIFQCFTKAGISPITVDLRGNNILHEVVQSRDMTHNFPKFWDKLMCLGLDPDQVNNAGKTPLHIACHRRLVRFVSESSLLETSNAINVPDLQGLRPIHHAASASECFMKPLRRAGADPFVVTVERKNVLHIAARCRRSENLRWLLSWMNELDPKRTGIFVNQKDTSDYTPLHYACRSAIHKSQEDRKEPWFPPIFQCVFFCWEQRLWKAPLQNNGILVAPGVVMDPRPSTWQKDPDTLDSQKFDPATDAARFEEIIQMMLSAGEDKLLADCQRSNPAIIDAMEFAARNGNDYATELLCQIYEETPEPRPLSFSVLMSKARREAERQSLCDPGNVRKGEANWDLVQRCLINHQYSSILEIHKAGADFTLSVDIGPPIISRLAQAGFARLVDECSSPEDAAQINCKKGGDWLTADLCNPGSVLVAACRTAFSNMAVLQVLVEKKGADNKDDGLHYFAGGSVWWQVAQGIPYLVSKGADLENRNKHKETPLHVALKRESKDAVKALLALGADANAVNSSGQSCLTVAEGNEDLIDLLISHGAKVDQGVLRKAISETARAGSILKILLSTDEASALIQPVNRRLENITGLDPSSKEVEDMLGWPLFFDVCTTGASGNQNMKALLEAGASLYETCLIWNYRRNDPDEDTPAVIIAATRIWTEDGSAQISERTIAHEFFSRNGPWKPILELKDFALERRDAAGRTFLLAATHVLSERGYGSSSDGIAAIILLKLGADPHAVDDCGRNALHHLLGSQMLEKDKHAVMQHMERVVLDLINKADNFGYYPLHYCLASLLGRSLYVNHPQEPVADLINYILSYGADTAIVDKCGNSLLHYLVCGFVRHTIISKDLVKEYFTQLARSGPDINARNKVGWSLAHSFIANSAWSSAETCIPIIDMLDELRVDWHAKDDLGRTVLHLAGASDTEIFEKLMEKGLDPWLEDIEGRNSLDMAAAHDNKKILRMFGERKDEE